MGWRPTQMESRRQWLGAMDANAVAHYEDWVGKLSPQEEDAYLEELERIPVWKDGSTILDAGAGTGTLCRLILRLFKGELHALEPCPLMLERLVSHFGADQVRTSQGFCDGPEDRSIFPAEKFQVIVSRQVVNGLYDPVVAFGNWLDWLNPGGSVIVIDGIYPRSAWLEIGEEKADQFPASSNQSIALVPYLLELAGFKIEKVCWMEGLNRLPGTRTPRYLVHATKPASI